MVIVILAEKEKQAEAYATALGQFSKKKGVYVIRQSLYFPAEVHVVAAEGHLFEYSEPDNWSLDKLPLTNFSLESLSSFRCCLNETFVRGNLSSDYWDRC